MNNKIPIFYTVDNNYIPLLAVSIASLIDHTSKNNQYIINIIYREVEKDCLKKLENLKKDNIEINFYDIEDKIKPIEDKLKNKTKKTHFPITVYFRIFLSALFCEYDKGIYIDADTVLNDDIKKLYDYDLQDKLIGGIKDNSISNIKEFTEYIDKAVGVKDGEYINSGVLLMNMKKLREVHLKDRFLYFLTKYDFNIIAPDQDYLNALCKDKILYISNIWNAMPIINQKEMPNPKLIHYNLFLKPWHYDNVSYEKYFWKYANISEFKKEIFEEKNNFNDKKKLNDKETLSQMLQKAKEITNMDITFRNIFKKEERL